RERRRGALPSSECVVRRADGSCRIRPFGTSLRPSLADLTEGVSRNNKHDPCSRRMQQDETRRAVINQEVFDQSLRSPLGLNAAPPGAGPLTREPAEDPREVALVGEAAGEGNLSQRRGGVAQYRFRRFPPSPQQPLMRGQTRGPLKGPREMTDGQAAFRGDIGKRQVAGEVRGENFLGPFLLPWRQPAARRANPEPGIGLQE